MTATPTKQRTGGNGRGGDGPFRLDAPQKRRVQGPQLVMAFMVVGVSALIAIVMVSRASAREPVVALATDVGRGEVVEVGDLRVAYVASDDPVATVPGDALGSLVGRVAVADFPAGSLVAPGFFVDREVVTAGEGVVGLTLAPGEYPTVQLAPGDLVDVVSTETGTVVVAGAEVFDVTDLGTQGSRFVSLRMPASDAATVAAMAGTGDLRLVLVAGDGS